VRSLKYSIEARKSIKDLARFIGQTQGETARKTFRTKIDIGLKLLAESPDLWPTILLSYNKYPMRRAIVHSRTIILYTFDDKYVYIDAVFDARSDWKK
jgi:plasmid stabilization system protein ParE